MITTVFLGALLMASDVLACAGHQNHYAMADRKRAEMAPLPAADWAYEASFNWGRLNPSKLKLHARRMIVIDGRDWRYMY